jgi:hypothetical protein
MKIIVKDAQEAIEIADVLSHAARSVLHNEDNIDIPEERIEEIRDYLYSMRDRIEVGK